MPFPRLNAREPITVEAVSDRSRFDALHEEWNRLVSESGAIVPFLTHEWFTCVLDAYPTPRLRILVARADGGRAVAIAPLWAYERRERGLALRAIGFITTPETPLVDFLVAPAWREEALAAFLRALRETTGEGWDVLVLNQWPDRSANGALLESLHRAARGRSVTALASITPVTPIRGPWQDFLKTRSALFRKSRRGIVNRVERRGGAVVELVRDDPNGRVLEEVLDLARRTWKAGEEIAITSRGEAVDFFRRLTATAGRSGWLHLWLLRVDGALVAMEYDLAHDGIVYALRADYAESAKELSPGAYLEHELLKRLFDEGYREYHAGPGLNPYKLRWADLLERNLTVTLCGDTLRGRLFALVEGPIARTWRRWRGEGKSAAAGDGWRAEADAAATRGDALASGAARAARILGALALLQTLADRFRLSRGADGRVRAPYLRRYRGDEYHVFTYHRVNDEGAPFFRGVAVRDFTTQMELLRERCDVLSLEELRSGAAAGTLPPRAVGITFDDGYRDNFENAFPVLRRLGLPATIFLSTGPLENGAPLWHDRVFDAFARSQAEAMLWGTERLPLDTYSDRSAALRRVLGELRRSLPERRTELIDRLIELLGVTEDPSLGRRMLEWSQVEEMSRSGVAFGAHTVTHPILTRMAHADARAEIEDSKRRIEGRVGKPVRWFAYPNGTSDDFNDAIKAILRDLEFTGAFTTLWGRNDARTDPFEMKRVGLWESDRDRSAMRLLRNQFAG